jgi:uncharacterized protein YjiS (DUF1127 family)
MTTLPLEEMTMRSNVPTMYRGRFAPRLDGSGRLAQIVAETIAVIFVEWRRRIRSRRELMTLGEHDLTDIGCTRCDMQWEVRKPFWRE